MARRKGKGPRTPRQASNQALMREFDETHGRIYSAPAQVITPASLVREVAKRSLLQDLYVGKDAHRRLAVPFASSALERWSQAEAVRAATKFWETPGAEQQYGFYPETLHHLGLRTLAFEVLKDLQSRNPNEKLGLQFHPARQAAYVVASEALLVVSGNEEEVRAFDSERDEPRRGEAAGGSSPAHRARIDYSGELDSVLVLREVRF